jgi:colanic acid/amylovoran biosynthesis glycosyltransferase
MIEVKRMKVLFLCSEFPAISETFIRSQIDFLSAQKDIEVDIFADAVLRKNQLLDKYPNQIGLYSNTSKVLLFPSHFFRLIFRNPRLLFESLNVFKYGRDAYYLKLFYALAFLYNRDYDVLIAHFGRTGNIAAFVKKIWLKDAKLLCVFHGRDIRAGVSSNGQIYKGLFENADYILSISEYNYKHLKKWGARNIVSLPNGIDVSRFVVKPEKKSEDVIKILSVGRLTWEKGYFYAIDAIKGFLQNNPSVKISYEIIGDGPLKEKLADYIGKNNLENNVILHGAKMSDEVLKFYQKSDIFLLSSIAEALPVVILEAASCELPVIATNVGSVYEEVEDGKSGFLVKPKSSKSIYEKLKILVKDKKKREEFGRRGREIVIEKFNSKKINEKLLDLIKK